MALFLSSYCIATMIIIAMGSFVFIVIIIVAATLITIDERH